MTTDRRAYRIDQSNPGSDLAGETAAAMAAASMVFHGHNPVYSAELLRHAEQVCLVCFHFIIRKGREIETHTFTSMPLR